MGDDFFKEAVNSLNLGVCFLDKNKKITYWNKGAENLTGFSSLDIMGKKFGLAKNECPIAATILDGNQRATEAHIKHRNGRKVHVSVRVTPVRGENDEITGASVMFHDISSQIVMINKLKDLERSASYDFLTQLPNRRLFERSLNSRFEEMQRGATPFGVIFMDIDNFKLINDSYGHDVGDLVLKMVAKKLATTLRPYDILGRWGGEEFVALVPHVSKEQLHAVSSRLRSMVERASIFTGDSVIKVTLSIGATLATGEDSIQSIIKRADGLMYVSKTTGKNKVTLEVKN
jgi:diguanylate cyclase (GGDEF)-like protein/PAS domain S-box-containing protein